MTDDSCEYRSVETNALVARIINHKGCSQRCYTKISQPRGKACSIREYRWSVRGVGGEMTRSAKLVMVTTRGNQLTTLALASGKL
jgi:hypothetical protein